MSDLDEAFQDAIDAAAEAKGKSETVLFRGIAIPALITTVMGDPIPLAGGYGNEGTFQVMISLGSVAGQPVRKLEAIEVRGLELSVLQADPNESHWILTVGDEVTEDMQ